MVTRKQRLEVALNYIKEAEWGIEDDALPRKFRHALAEIIEIVPSLVAELAELTEMANATLDKLLP